MIAGNLVNFYRLFAVTGPIFMVRMRTNEKGVREGGQVFNTLPWELKPSWNSGDLIEVVL
jgi:hypothetical protein